MIRKYTAQVVSYCQHRFFVPQQARKGRQGYTGMREALLFSGLRRPAVRVVEHQKIFGRRRSGFIDETGEPPAAIALVIETTGNGRPYQVKYAEGWWRDLAEVQIDDERTVVRFLQMRGDPFGELEPGRPISTAYWADLIRVLRRAASAWQPVGEHETIAAAGAALSARCLAGPFAIRNWRK